MRTPTAAVLGVGCNNFGGFADRAAAEGVVDAAFELGVAHFDTADAYPPDDPGASESILGELLRGRRDDAVVATKFGYNWGHPDGRADAKYIASSLDASLRRLDTDRIDLYQLHRPASTPIGETLEALVPLVRAGKVLQIGCSNFGVSQLSEARVIADELGVAMFATDQVELSAVVPQHELLATCEEVGVGVIAYFVLASGLLTGKYRRDAPLPRGTRLTPVVDDPITRRFADRFPIDDYLDVVEALLQYARECGHSIIELALGWVVAQGPVSTVLVGATSAAQLHANVDAFSAWEMSGDEISGVNELVHRLRGGGHDRNTDTDAGRV